MELCTDLHIHTTESDGTATPTEVVIESKKAGLKAIAITDHDCVNGVTEALIAAKEHNIELISGIEFSTLYNEQELHILGYYIDVANKNLRQEANYIAEARRVRAEKIVKKLNSLGINICFDRVKSIASGEVIGRPHIAQAMIEKKYIDTIQQAFSKMYIDKGGRAYVDRYKLAPESAIKLIHNAGGLAIVAHPGLCYQSKGLVAENIHDLIKLGLDGIEVFHSAHNKEQQEYYKSLALKNSLLITGGSDYHGKTKKEGSEIGSVCLPYKYVKDMKHKVMMYKLK
ncbi:PHP domain-containing protein [Clostridium sp. 'deep sea']|uniref:PHP domain-containing protein n=1 Tax=Clostridium sp. 'deep sea' TaxID=2779445 RepID=UPI001896A25A|nr:PHP domain-containing protein [Clostridium sp. 'deep sea']QOR36111.1 PHP domain-containing protein [Clostridium sp. 'deep sea']